MVNPVSTALYTGAPIVAHTAAFTERKAPAQATDKTPAKEDQVTLSADAQAQLLEQQGRSVPQISLLLGLSTSTVDSYLGIKTIYAAVSRPVASAAVLQRKLA